MPPEVNIKDRRAFQQAIAYIKGPLKKGFPKPALLDEAREDLRVWEEAGEEVNPEQEKALVDSLRTKLVTILNGEETSKANRRTYDKQFFDSIDNLLIILAKEWPVNAEDPASMEPIEEIAEKDRVIVTSGHQFDIIGLIKFHNSKVDRLRADKRYDDIPLVNPITNLPFVERDVERVKAIVARGIQDKEGNHLRIKDLLEGPPIIRVPGRSTPSTWRSLKREARLGWRIGTREMGILAGPAFAIGGAIAGGVMLWKLGLSVGLAILAGIATGGVGLVVGIVLAGVLGALLAGATELVNAFTKWGKGYYIIKGFQVGATLGIIIGGIVAAVAVGLLMAATFPVWGTALAVIGAALAGAWLGAVVLSAVGVLLTGIAACVVNLVNYLRQPSLAVAQPQPQPAPENQPLLQQGEANPLEEKQAEVKEPTHKNPRVINHGNAMRAHGLFKPLSAPRGDSAAEAKEKFTPPSDMQL